MKFTDYEQVQEVKNDNILLMDGPDGTKSVLATFLATGLIQLLSAKDLSAVLDMSSLDSISEFGSGNQILVGTDEGNKVMAGDDVLFAILDAYAPVEVRRTVFRGKKLGDALTEDQIASIQDGSFKGMFLGDYWEIGGYTWRIADFDYWLYKGDTSFTSHHVLVWPDENLGNQVMNETNTTEGGYVGSKMYTDNLANAKSLFRSAFGSSHVLTHRVHLTNAVTNGYPSGGTWYDSEVELPNEIMIYGTRIFSACGDGSFVPNNYTVDSSQLALTQVDREFINKGRYAYWLRDVVSATYFAAVSSYGLANCLYASNSRGVRPVAAIG